MLILALIYGHGADDAIDKKTNEISPAALLAAIRKVRSENLLTVFCQADRAVLAAKDDEAHLMTLLDAFVRPVPVAKTSQGGFSSFHSKVWLAAFEKNDGSEEKAFRLIVTSRNLTSNRDFDAVAVFDSTDKGNGGVVDVIKRQVDVDKEGQVGELFRDFDDARFGIGAFSFLKDGVINAARLGKCHSIFSPFLDPVQLDGLKPEHPINIFSSQQEIYKLGEIVRNEKFRFFMLNPDLNEHTENEDRADGRHFGLHAKLYISDDAVILGSSNFTYRGLTRNREFNVEIKKGIREDDLLDYVGVGKKENESPQERQARERSGMFLPYQAPPEPEKEPDAPEEKLNEILQALACGPLKAEYVDGKLSLTVPYRPEAGVTIRWKPFLQGEEDFKDPGKEALCWDVSKENVCRIFDCEVEIGGAEARIQMLAELDADLWDERFTAEKRKISIDDEINFKMLNIEGVENLYGREVPLRRDAGGRAGCGQTRMPQPPIFERLLEADRDRLKRFFLDDPLQKREDGEDPSGLYEAFVEMGRFFGFDPEVKRS